MKKLLVLGAICFGASLALALPPAGEITKAQKVISVLMADDIAALKAGKKTPVELGDAAVAFSKEAETEAMKYVLLKGALEYYVRGKDYDKAADAAEAMRNSVKDLAPEDLVDAIRSSARGVRGSVAPRLLAILRTARAQAKAKEGIAEARRALRKDVTDVTARRALAEWLAASGDWSQALEAFIELGGKAGKTAQAETEKKDLVAAADFWWEYEPGVVPSPDVFRAHAVALYKQELEKGELTGLKKAFVEKRLQQAETAVAESAPVRATAKETKDVSPTVPTGLVHRWSFNGGFDDSVGSINAKPGGNWRFENGQCVLDGGWIILDKSKASLNEDFTVEIWTTENERAFGSRIFNIYLHGKREFESMGWATGGSHEGFFHTFSESKSSRLGRDGFELGKEVYVAVTCKMSGDNSKIVAYLYDYDKKKLYHFATEINWPEPHQVSGFSLGNKISWTRKYHDCHSSYNECRVWKRCLSRSEIERSAKAGPNQLR